MYLPSYKLLHWINCSVWLVARRIGSGTIVTCSTDTSGHAVTAVPPVIAADFYKVHPETYAQSRWNPPTGMTTVLLVSKGDVQRQYRRCTAFDKTSDTMEISTIYNHPITLKVTGHTNLFLICDVGPGFGGLVGSDSTSLNDFNVAWSNCKFPLEPYSLFLSDQHGQNKLRTVRVVYCRISFGCHMRHNNKNKTPPTHGETTLHKNIIAPHETKARWLLAKEILLWKIVKMTSFFQNLHKLVSSTGNTPSSTKRAGIT